MKLSHFKCKNTDHLVYLLKLRVNILYLIDRFSSVDKKTKAMPHCRLKTVSKIHMLKPFISYLFFIYLIKHHIMKIKNVLRVAAASCRAVKFLLP